MWVVIDSVSLNHLLRKPKRAQSSPRRKSPGLKTSLDNHLQIGTLRICLDSKDILKSEWEQTCGIEAIHILINHWSDLQGIILISKIPTLGTAVSRKLRRLGFTDTIDKFILKLGP